MTRSVLLGHLAILPAFPPSPLVLSGHSPGLGIDLSSSAPRNLTLLRLRHGCLLHRHLRRRRRLFGVPIRLPFPRTRFPGPSNDHAAGRAWTERVRSSIRCGVDPSAILEEESHMNRVTSKDGTSIGYERMGSGPSVILVGGGLDDGSENAPLAPELAERFTVYNYARRGRSDSGDTHPYAVEREIEDLEALIAEAGGSAHLYGVSSGGALALEAAAAGSAVDKLAVYEVPYRTADDWPQRWREYVEHLGALLAEGRRGDALELFMRLAGSSEEMIVSARNSPMWPDLEAIAHTLAYDAACLGNGHPPTARLATITRPTLVATGRSPDPHMGGSPIDFDQAADAIAASIPQAERQSIEGQSHVADPKAVAAVLERFFTG
jgi:pimeloyl-ACP methyl ester carboxylesterase